MSDNFNSQQEAVAALLDHVYMPAFITRLEQNGVSIKNAEEAAKALQIACALNQLAEKNAAQSGSLLDVAHAAMLKEAANSGIEIPGAGAPATEPDPKVVAALQFLGSQKAA